MNTALKNFGTLFTETWGQYKERALTILGVMLLIFMIIIGGMTLAGVVAGFTLGGFDTVVQQAQGGQFNLPVLLVFCLFFLVITVLVLWYQSAIIAVVLDDNMGVREALRVGWQRLWSVGWIFMLGGSILMSGFLLFLVPGILLSISLMFALYPLYDDDLRGMDALQASRSYVKGRWWNTLGKALIIWLIAIVLDLIPYVGPFVNLLFMPFLLLFFVAMYRNLKETATETMGDAGRTGMWLLAVLGFILMLAGMIGAVVSLGPQLPGLLQQTQSQADRQVDAQLPQVVPPISQSGEEEQDVLASTETGDSIWHDPIGDVTEFGVGRWLDLQAVTVRADGGTLLIDLHTATPLSAAFNAASTTAQSIYRLAIVYFDSDVDRVTGGKAGKGAGRSGYDVGFDINLEAPRNDPENGQVHVGLFRLENGVRRFLGPLPEDHVQVRGNQIRLHLPYETLGIQAGNQVRMSFLEASQEQGSGLSKDKLIDL